MVLVDADKRAAKAQVCATRKSAKARRNDRCRCGSGKKHKSCCLEKDQREFRKRCESTLPPWLLESPKKLHQFEKYACMSYGVAEDLKGVGDGRRRPDIPLFDVLNSLFHGALFRTPSFNAMIGNLGEADFQMLLGKKPKQGTKLFSHKVIGYTLDKLELDDIHNLIPRLIWKAERNKAFREYGYGTMRLVAVDGWEPFSSYDRHCPHCLVRKVKHKRKDGTVVKVDQFYHRYVVAMMVDPVLDVVLAIEPVRNGEARKQDGEDEHHEGELTAAHRLIDQLKETYGTFIDGFVMDALYANGPVMTKLKKYNYGALIVLKKEDHEPFKEALAIWDKEPPCRSVDDPDKKEHIEFWDVDDIDTLDTFKGKVRVIRAVVSDEKGNAKATWCFAAVGDRVRKLGLVTALKAMRSRWHIENTAFGQWVQHWNLGRVFRHTPKALLAVLLLWSLVFNLLQLFIYRRIKRDRRPKDHADTIRHIVEVMLRAVAALPEPIPWEEILCPG